MFQKIWHFGIYKQITKLTVNPEFYLHKYLHDKEIPNKMFAFLFFSSPDRSSVCEIAVASGLQVWIVFVHICVVNL